MRDKPTPKERIDHHRKRLDHLKNEYDTHWKAHHQEISENVQPRMGRFLADSPGKENDGSKKNENIVDSEATLAHRNAAAGIQSGLTSSSMPWFRLTLQDRDLAKYTPVRWWLEEVKNRIMRVMQKSNFYQSTYGMYEQLIAFGTASMMILTDHETIIRCYPFEAGEYYLGQDDTNRIDSIYRCYNSTAYNIVKKFGVKNVSKTVREAFEKDRGDSWFKVVHAIEPNNLREPGKIDNLNMPYTSVYFEYDNKDKANPIFLREGGFNQFPCMTPRWSVNGSEVYGRSPTMDALADIKMLQTMQERTIEAIEKMVDPPVNAPADMKKKAVSILPGAVNFSDMTSSKGGMSAVYEVRPDIKAIEYKIERVHESIDRTLFNDLFLMIANERQRNKTATEVTEISDERMRLLAPVIERICPELLDTAIDRIFAIMETNGMIPPPPDELTDQDIEIEYVSILAQRQKLVSINSIRQWIAFVMGVAEGKPEIMDTINADEVSEEAGDILGVPPKVIAPKEQREAIRKKREQEIEQLKQQEQSAQMAQGVKTLSETDTDSNNALTQIAGAMV